MYCGINNINFNDANRNMQYTMKIMQENWKAVNPDADQIAEDNLPVSQFKETISEGQGSQRLRKAVVAATTTSANTHILSPQAIRDARHCNETLADILKFKRMGHGLSLKGEMVLANGDKATAECFNETFALPMLASSFETFALQSHDPEILEISKAFKTIFAEALYHDNSDDHKIQKAVKEISEGSQTKPLLVASGWNWHSTQVIFFNDFFAYCNRGADCDEKPGWHLYQIGNKEIITAEWLQKLTRRISISESEYLSHHKLIDDLQAKHILSHMMQGQKVGNCTYTSLKAAISCLLYLWEINPHFKLKLAEEMLLQDKHLLQCQDGYKAFTAFDRQLIVHDLMIDLENAVKALPSQPSESITMMAELLYIKLGISPKIGLKLGWQQWLKAVMNCQLLCNPVAISEEWMKLTAYLSAQQPDFSAAKGIDVDQLKTIGLFFIDQKSNETKLTSIIKTLILNGYFDAADLLLEKAKEKNSLKSLTITCITKLLIRMGLLKKATETALLSQELNWKDETLEDITLILINENELVEAEKVAVKISDREKMLQEIGHKLIKNENFSEAKRIALRLSARIREQMFNRICQALALQERYVEAEELTKSIPEDSFFKYLYFQDLCAYLVIEGKTALAVQFASTIPDTHQSKSKAFKSICEKLLIKSEWENVIKLVKSAPCKMVEKHQLTNTAVSGLIENQQTAKAIQLIDFETRDANTITLLTYIAKGFAKDEQWDDVIDLIKYFPDDEDLKYTGFKQFAEICKDFKNVDMAIKLFKMIPKNDQEINPTVKYTIFIICELSIKKRNTPTALDFVNELTENYKYDALNYISECLIFYTEYEQAVTISNQIPDRSKFKYLYLIKYDHLLIGNGHKNLIVDMIPQIPDSHKNKYAIIKSTIYTLASHSYFEDIVKIAQGLSYDIEDRSLLFALIINKLIVYKRWDEIMEIVKFMIPKDIIEAEMWDVCHFLIKLQRFDDAKIIAELLPAGLDQRKFGICIKLLEDKHFNIAREFALLISSPDLYNEVLRVVSVQEEDVTI